MKAIKSNTALRGFRTTLFMPGTVLSFTPPLHHHSQPATPQRPRRSCEKSQIWSQCFHPGVLEQKHLKSGLLSKLLRREAERKLLHADEGSPALHWAAAPPPGHTPWGQSQIWISLCKPPSPDSEDEDPPETASAPSHTTALTRDTTPWGPQQTHTSQWNTLIRSRTFRDLNYLTAEGLHKHAVATAALFATAPHTSLFTFKSYLFFNILLIFTFIHIFLPPLRRSCDSRRLSVC